MCRCGMICLACLHGLLQSRKAIWRASKAAKCDSRQNRHLLAPVAHALHIQDQMVCSKALSEIPVCPCQSPCHHTTLQALSARCASGSAGLLYSVCVDT